jgi:hypothetical protein
LLDSSLPDDDEELDDPDPLEVELVDDSVLVEGVVVVEDSVPVDALDDSVPVEVPLVVDEAEAFSAAAFFAAALAAAAFLADAFAAALFAAMPLELDVLATSADDAVVFLLESAGSCPEASWT